MTDFSNPPAYSLATAPAPSVQGVQAYNGPAGQSPPMITTPAGPPIQMVTLVQPTRVYERYSSKASMGLGITQVIAGVLCIVFNAVGIAFGALISFASIGIWGGIMFIISGSFGISAAKWRTKCKVIAFMVLSIISATITVPLFICCVIGAALDSYNYYCYSYYYNYYQTSYNCRDIRNVAIAMNSLLACLAIIEAVAAIWGSAICCKAACCCNSSGNQQVVVPIQYATVQGQPVIIIQQSHPSFGGQMMAYSASGIPTQQILNVPAPSYSASYGTDNAVGYAYPPNNGLGENGEKQPL
jgi:hypothetical protein